MYEPAARPPLKVVAKEGSYLISVMAILHGRNKANSIPTFTAAYQRHKGKDDHNAGAENRYLIDTLIDSSPRPLSEKLETC